MECFLLGAARGCPHTLVVRELTVALGSGIRRELQAECLLPSAPDTQQGCDIKQSHNSSLFAAKKKNHRGPYRRNVLQSPWVLLDEGVLVLVPGKQLLPAPGWSVRDALLKGSGEAKDRMNVQAEQGRSVYKAAFATELLGVRSGWDEQVSLNTAGHGQAVATSRRCSHG